MGTWKRNITSPLRLPSDIRFSELPWRQIFMTIAVVLIAAWFVGFGAGLIVRFAVPWR